MTADSSTLVAEREPVEQPQHQTVHYCSAAANGIANGIRNGHSETHVNSWSSPGSAAFDFRSDTVTRPTASMLAAITHTTLADDDFQQDPTTLSLEALVAELTGHEAALLVTSGTGGNQISMRTHLLSPPHALLADRRSHVLTHESGGVAMLTGAMTIPVIPKNGLYLTLEDVQREALVKVSHVTDCPTKLICLENTCGGVVMPLSECRRISAWAREHGVKMHLDGARLWEAVAAGKGTLKEYCECFDSVNLCFSKGLGAPIGSVIVGSWEFRERARWIRKAVGGGMRQSGVVAAAARVGVEETFLGCKLEQSHRRARQVAAMWEGKGGRLTYPVDTNMVWLDIEKLGLTEEEFIKGGEKFGISLMGARVVCHYQICDEAVEQLRLYMESLMARRQATVCDQWGVDCH